VSLGGDAGHRPRLRRIEPAPSPKMTHARARDPATLRQRARQTEPEVVDTKGGMAAAAARRTTAPRFIGPTTPAKHTVGAVDRFVEEIPAPLPHIAEHVVEAPRIRSFRAHGMCVGFGVADVPSDFVEG